MKCYEVPVMTICWYLCYLFVFYCVIYFEVRVVMLKCQAFSVTEKQALVLGAWCLVLAAQGVNRIASIFCVVVLAFLLLAPCVLAAQLLAQL